MANPLGPCLGSCRYGMACTSARNRLKTDTGAWATDTSFFGTRSILNYIHVGYVVIDHWTVSTVLQRTGLDLGTWQADDAKAGVCSSHG